MLCQILHALVKAQLTLTFRARISKLTATAIRRTQMTDDHQGIFGIGFCAGQDNQAALWSGHLTDNHITQSHFMDMIAFGAIRVHGLTGLGAALLRRAIWLRTSR